MRFEFPKGVAVDASGFVYVTDDENHRIQKFDTNGNFISEWEDAIDNVN
jgi:DNA-binding beta-propeller fold protein YncE